MTLIVPIPFKTMQDVIAAAQARRRCRTRCRMGTRTGTTQKQEESILGHGPAQYFKKFFIALTRRIVLPLQMKRIRDKPNPIEFGFGAHIHQDG